ncbi:acyltransferase [Nostoc sp. TCL240-02]|uniref:acyltransferase family protein n=1 Tax=Nostoc sp. TCL240-02 TaxID=2572090 RepID=UPI00157FB9B9|nr:acyltransferase [Nostoc sp. TCL240-02]QKQ77348.1 acyltransferase [Nostoc sp. TCL240-02]
MLPTIQTDINNHNRLDALLALRAFACLMVVMTHCNPPRNAIFYKGYDLSWLTFSPGGVGVWIFFSLSGYLMGKAFYTERYTADVPGVINFWRNRLLRICPLYYFAVLILALFVYTDILKIENWGYLFRIITFTYNQSFPPTWNGAMWSLSTEVQFYILVPFLYIFLLQRLVSRKQFVIIAIFIIFFTFIVRLIFWISLRHQISEQIKYVIEYSYTPLVTNIDLFICGFIVNGLIFNNQKMIKIKKIKEIRIPQSYMKYFAIILLITLYMLTAHHLYYQELWNLPERAGKGIRTSTAFFIWQPITALITSFFIFVFEFEMYQPSIKNETLSFSAILRNPLRVVELFGNISYGVYIWHIPIITKISPILTSQIPIEAFYMRLINTLVLSTLLASITYYVIEVPFSRWKTYQKIEMVKY